MSNEHRRRWNVSWYEDDVHARGTDPNVNARVQRYGKRLTARRERREEKAVIAEARDQP